MAAKTPPGFEGFTPYLAITNAADAIEFYKKAFDATEGGIGHLLHGLEGVTLHSVFHLVFVKLFTKEVVLLVLDKLAQILLDLLLEGFRTLLG